MLQSVFISEAAWETYQIMSGNAFLFEVGLDYEIPKLIQYEVEVLN